MSDLLNIDYDKMILSPDDVFKLSESFLLMEWIRPENVVWATVAASLIGPVLLSGGMVAEYAIGNGNFTFLALGGRFKGQYDWYYNVDTEGFWEGKDIYDQCLTSDISKYIEIKSPKRLKYAVDIKQSLLDQVSQLDFVDSLICADANRHPEIGKVDMIYSNALYWLEKPWDVLCDWSGRLNGQGRIVIVFPNSYFYRYCESYTSQDKIWRLINRGRAESMLWNMDIGEFESSLSKVPGMEMVYFRRYLSRKTLKIWDIGLRLLSPFLIRMGNSMNPDERWKIKKEWCEACRPFVHDFLSHELEHGNKEGGFNFIVLEKST